MYFKTLLLTVVFVLLGAGLRPLVDPVFLRGSGGYIRRVYEENSKPYRVSGHYSNIQYCNSKVSILAAHERVIIGNLVPIAVDENLDIMVTPVLDEMAETVAKGFHDVASKAPEVGDKVYISYFLQGVPIVNTGTILWYDSNEVVIEAVGFFGASGSPIYNIYGEYIGSLSKMLVTKDGTAGFLVYGTNYDVTIKILKEKVCK